MPAVTGDVLIDFGSTPNGHATAVVTGQAGITLSSKVEAYLDPSIAVALGASNGPTEHTLADIKVSCSDIVAGVGFTITGFYRANHGLTGTWAVTWVYTT